MASAVVGVVGAGVIGASLSEDLAQHGFRTVLVDLLPDALEGARVRIRRSLRAARLFASASDAEAPDDILARIVFTTDIQALASVDFVIENVTEDVGVKEGVYKELDSVCDEGCVLIANTSCIPIARLGSFTGRPSRVVGVHFMNPVPKKCTVELIPSSETSEATLEKTKALLQQLEKEFILVKDSPGFVSNRVLMLTINEAVRLLEEGVASEDDIDRVFKSCFGHAMGPLETADLIGLDTVVGSLRVLLDCYGDPKYQPTRRLEELVAAGQLGRKTGKGLHSYR